MDNLTHTLVGLAVSKAGLERLSPGTSSLCIVAANAPDLDVITGIFGDRWTALHYHRGITHSFAGTVVIALVLPLAFCSMEAIVARLRTRSRKLRLPGLLLASFIASATHPLLDWTNNYGVRLLLPWNSKWFYGDLVFIVDPYVWLTFGVAAFLLTANSRWRRWCWCVFAAALTILVAYAGLLRSALPHSRLLVALWLAVIVGSVVAYRGGMARRWGGKLALMAFTLLVVYWGGLALLHHQAVKQARTYALGLAVTGNEHVLKLAAMPTVADPLRWRCVVETDRSFYRFDLSLLKGRKEPLELSRFAKPAGPAARLVGLAEQDRRARALLEFARFPLARVSDTSCVGQALVQLADLRYTEPGRARGSFALELPITCPTESAAENGR